LLFLFLLLLLLLLLLLICKEIFAYARLKEHSYYFISLGKILLLVILLLSLLSFFGEIFES
jgi:hypothetical protein